MNTQSNAVPESSLDSQVTAPAAISATRPMYWSVRRELWENRSIYIAPLAVAALYMLGFLISLMWLPHSMREVAAHHPAPQLVELAMPYGHATWLLLVTALLVGIFYSLDALHGERRDRSILFWKSLPVSDFTTVLSKASIPFVVLPLLVFAITVILQLFMWLLNMAVLLVSGTGAATFWGQLSFVQMSLLLLYHLVTVHALWPAPIYAWLLLVSGWARRAAFLWAVLPLLAIGVFEKIVFHTSHFAAMLGNRLSGGGAEAFTMPGTFPMDPMTHLTPGHFLSSPDLWIGLAIAAAFLAAAVRLRRYQGPI